MSKPEIFCPKCQVRPAPDEVWQCEAACGCNWHTFDTQGVCPKCGKHWEDTQCLHCHGWSPHAQWYHDRSDAKNRSEEIVLQA